MRIVSAVSHRAEPLGKRFPTTSVEHRDAAREPPRIIAVVKRARLEVWQDVDAKWRWRLRARNGRKIATSGESFGSRSNAIRAARKLFETFEYGVELVV